MTITLFEAQSTLPELLHGLSAGEEILITENNRPLATITTPKSEPKPVRQFGALRGSVLYMSPDFDAPLEDFRDYISSFPNSVW